VHVKDGVTEDDFVAMRCARDATLSAPTLLLPSIQVNIRAGRFPPAEANGVRYLKVPLTFKSGEDAVGSASSDLDHRPEAAARRSGRKGRGEEQASHQA